MNNESAVDHALEIYRFPSSLEAVRARPVPRDVNSLLRAVSGDMEEDLLRVDSSKAPALPPEEVIEFYIQQVLLHPQADVYRILGSRPEAPREALRANMALLLRWLHPDQNQDVDRTIYTGRVVEAWEQIKTLERRQSYDLQYLPAAMQNNGIPPVDEHSNEFINGVIATSHRSAGRQKSNRQQPAHSDHNAGTRYKKNKSRAKQSGHPASPVRYLPAGPLPSRPGSSKSGFFSTVARWLRRVGLIAFAVIVIGFILAPQDMMPLAEYYWYAFRVWFFEWSRIS